MAIMTYQLSTLKNGLRVASETLPGVESVAIAVSCGVGARYEEKNENGISHLLEHMAFKGTKTRSARDIAEAFDMIGGQFNAYTSMETTVYYAKVLKENVEVAMDILSDILQNSVFDADELKREQGVVIQEIAMHRDTPDDLIHDYFDETAFPDQALGRSILSSEEQVASYTRDDLIRYMDTHYRPPRMVVSAAGNITHEQLLSLTNTYFNLADRKTAKTYEPGNYKGGDIRVPRDLEQLHLLYGLPAISIKSPDYYTAQIYSVILGGGMSSRLFQEVREKRGLAYTVYSSISGYDDCGMLTLYAATAPDKASELSGVLCEQIAGMAQSISDAEFQRAKNQLKADLLMSRESTHSIATWIGRHLLVYGEYRAAKDVIARIEKISKEDIRRFAEKLTAGTLTVTALGNGTDGVLPYDALSARLSRRLAA
jgi:predicted Zn-dependent peptidase